MKKFNLWMVRHRGLTTLFISLILCSVYTLIFAALQASVVIIVIMDLLLIFASFCFAVGAAQRVIAPYLRELDNGDPYPFLNILEELLSSEMSDQNKIPIFINYGVALRAIGKYQEAFDLLMSINIDKFSSTLPITKFVYYNNLADICTITGNFEQANIWYFKMKQLSSAVKSKKQQKQMELTMLDADALDCFRNGRYDETIRIALIIYQKPNRTTRLNVGVGLMCAKAYIKLGDVAQAHSMLGNVIKYGGKLYEVTEAHRLLSELDGGNETN